MSLMSHGTIECVGLRWIDQQTHRLLIDYSLMSSISFVWNMLMHDVDPVFIIIIIIGRIYTRDRLSVRRVIRLSINPRDEFERKFTRKDWPRIRNKMAASWISSNIFSFEAFSTPDVRGSQPIQQYNYLLYILDQIKSPRKLLYVHLSMLAFFSNW